MHSDVRTQGKNAAGLIAFEGSVAKGAIEGHQGMSNCRPTYPDVMSGELRVLESVSFET